MGLFGRRKGHYDLQSPRSSLSTDQSTLISFGKRAAGCARRPNECLILEPSEMIAIDYPDIQLMKPVSQRPAAQNGLDRLLSMPLEQQERRLVDHRRMHSDSSIDPGDQVPPELVQVQSAIARSEALLLGAAGKRNSRASDTSSAYSGSDVMQSSVEEGEVDVTGLHESLVDSDEEEGYCDGPESMLVHDTVRDCLEKDPVDRTEDDIEVLLEAMQHMPAFANMTLAIRRRLCAVMVFAVVEEAGMVVMNDKEELDSWSVILNGHVEITRPDGRVEQLHMGDSFGITPTTEKLFHNGVMRTKIDDCQFVCIAQEDYFRILNEGEENTKRHEEEGEVVLVTEHRELDGGNRKGHIVIRGTPQRLLSHLVEEHSAVDPTYVEDLLLTYRTFLSSPGDVAQRLVSWFNDDHLRDRVTRVVLLWVNNHFNDFESQPEMSEFLEKFEQLLERERMSGQLRLLNIACAAKARPRTVVLTRATREEILHFSVLGGLERGTGIFISKVDRASKAHEVGLKRGDQILEVNNQNFNHISHNRALEILRGTTHLSVTVKSNVLAFKEMLVTPDSSPKRTPKKEHIAKLQNDPKQRLALLETPMPPIIQNANKEKKMLKGFTVGNKTKIRRALMRMNLLPRTSQTQDPAQSADDSSMSSTRSRMGSQSSTGSSPLHSGGLSASNPDLSSMPDTRQQDFPEHVIKVYKQDQTCKYFLIHPETTAREVVMLALREFGMTDPSSNFSLCEVTCEPCGLVKTRRLPDQLASLPERTALNGRYYLRNNMITEPLVPDELQHELTRDAHAPLLQLQPAEMAAQLTLRDFQLFMEIEPTEYIDDLFSLESKYGSPHLKAFSELVNTEMFWVVTEICSESNVVKRMKIIKHFIKIARHCKDCKNFNSMFAIVSGLNYSGVSRLRATWDKLPAKYQRWMEDLQDLMDPSRNMSKYRNLVSSEHVQPPMIPFFPVVKKDLTFIHLGNDSRVDELVNFEKLRMIAKEVRHVCTMATAQYDFSSMLANGASSAQSVFSAFSASGQSTSATLRRKRRASTMPNARKMYEEAQMVRRVRAYLERMKVVTDEKVLSDMSAQCEAPTGGPKKRDPSPSGTMDPKKLAELGPKFAGTVDVTPTETQKCAAESCHGVEEPMTVSKLLSLSEKVRPHNNVKNPVPARPLPASRTAPASPGLLRRSALTVSPKPARARPAAVVLSPESSSVISLSNMTLRKSASNSNSVGSGDASPTHGATTGRHPGDTDSGHSSVTSSNFDAHSTSSMSSQASPPQGQRKGALQQHPPVHAAGSAGGGISSNPPVSPVITSSSRRPPLPPYSELVHGPHPAYPRGPYHHNTPSMSTHLSAQDAHLPAHGPRLSAPARPPLPDYAQATRMAQLARLKAPGKHTDDNDINGAKYSPAEELEHLEITDAVTLEDEDEQVSAV